MLRRLEDLPHRAAFDDAACIHHRHAVAHASDDAEIMGDEQDRHAGLGLQALKQFQVLKLDRDVERSRRLIGDQHPWLAADGDGAHHALLHATAQLVRILADALFGCGDIDAAERRHRLLHHVGVRRALAALDCLAQLVADREDRIERGLRVLQHHRDPPPTDLAHFRRRALQDVLAVEQHLAFDGLGAALR